MKANDVTMIYSGDFKTQVTPVFDDYKINKNAFSVVIKRDNLVSERLEYSIANAMKPLAYNFSVCGTPLVKYTKSSIKNVSLLGKIYSLFIILGLAGWLIFVNPVSWRDTMADVPLNVLTKVFGIHHTAELLYSIFIVTFTKSGKFVSMLKKLDDIDNHFGIATITFMKRRLLSIFLLLIPILQLLCTLWLRKFYIQNIEGHLRFYLIMLQGSVFSFFIINIYTQHLILNILLQKKILYTITSHKKLIFKDSVMDAFIKRICCGPMIIERNLKARYCWFELMQIYDKIADSFYIFNDIYSGQIFIMFTTWLLSTILIICRSLSPTIKYSEVVVGDLLIYSFINSRPLFLAKMCELFIEERKKTLTILLHVLVCGDLEEGYFNQVMTMLHLVEARKLEISAKVSTINVSTVMTFAGRVISYVVLVIQYFYMHVFLSEILSLESGEDFTI